MSMVRMYVPSMGSRHGSRRVDQISIKTRSGRTPSGSTFRTESSVSSRLTIHPINRSVAACAALQVWPSRSMSTCVSCSRIGELMSSLASSSRSRSSGWLVAHDIVHFAAFRRVTPRRARFAKICACGRHTRVC